MEVAKLYKEDSRKVDLIDIMCPFAFGSQINKFTPSKVQPK